MSNVVEIRGLKKYFKEVHAVNGLDMNVQKGEIYGFLGPNGAGKTTTIKMIMSLSKPTAGTIIVHGKKADRNLVEVRRDIGFLPERISFYDNLTALQTMHFFCELKGVDRSVSEGLIKEVGLEDAMHRRVGTFSKGMTQLLGIAQAMIGKPSLYILDEPMSGLDARWVKVVRDKINKLNDDGATILFSSHILQEVQSLCDRIGIIDRGRMVEQDTLEAISGRLHLKPHLEVKIKDLKKTGLKLPQNLAGVERADVKGDTLYITCDAKYRMDVISAIKDAGYIIEDFKTIEPSLEESFMKLISPDENQGGSQ